MKTTVESDGEDLILVIPLEILSQSQLEIGDVVELTVENNSIVIAPSQKG
jgi:antitoxin component of MazEF toxin-antitoxin module